MIEKSSWYLKPNVLTYKDINILFKYGKIKPLTLFNWLQIKSNIVTFQIGTNETMLY